MSKSGASQPRGYAFFEWINRHVSALSVVVVALAVVLGVVGPLIASDDQPEFNPSGEIYDTEDLVEERFDSDSPIREAAFFVEVAGVPASPTAADHDVLTRAALLEFKQNSDAVRAAFSAGDEDHLATVFDNDLNAEIDGIFSIADVVDAMLPGGLEGSTEAGVKLLLADLLAEDSPTSGLRFTLSRLATREPEVVGGETIPVWRAPAFIAQLRYDLDTFPGEEIDGMSGITNLDAERWLRQVQTDLRGDGAQTSVLGIAIDGGLVGEEQAASAAPFIFLAVALILLLVGALLRSYWAMALAAIGLGVVMMGYNGINALIGLKTQSPLIVFVVPIALISFGIDFFIHGSGRVREMQVAGHPRERAYPLGATALFWALLLAAGTSVGAFLSNSASGIQAITEFGIAAAVAIVLSYLVLGVVAPRQLVAVETALGPRPDPRGLHIVQKVAFTAAAVVAGMVVTLTIVMPAIGAALFVVVVLGGLFGLPYWLTGRRNRKAAAAGKALTDEVKGSGHGFAAAGSVVHFVARWRAITVPVVVLLAALGGWAAFQVDTAFQVTDFFSSKTDLLRSLDKVETHLGSSASAPAYIYVEGDLSDPEALQAMEGVLARLDAADRGGDIDLVRDFNDDLEVPLNAMEVVRLVIAVPEARAAVAAAAGVEITDTDGNGLPDDAAQVAALYAVAGTEGVAGPGGVTLLRPDQVQSAVYRSDGTQGTRVEVILPSFTDDPNILATRALLNEEAASLEADLTALGSRTDLISVSGEAITAQDGLSSFTESMRTSLPIAAIITFLLAWLVMRSVRYAFVAMVPIALVVLWIYGFMFLAGYTINVITATIAAIAIGVGIDFATHFTMRFREEFRGEPSRFPALRRAGEGTGGALALSALTSMTGFLVMAFAPMPMFATFGVLTAVMVFLALAVSLLVLPSLLLLPFVTPSRRGEERAELEEALTGGEVAYEPHARETAHLSRSLDEADDR